MPNYPVLIKIHKTLIRIQRIRDIYLVVDFADSTIFACQHRVLSGWNSFELWIAGNVQYLDFRGPESSFLQQKVMNSLTTFFLLKVRLL